MQRHLPRSDGAEAWPRGLFLTWLALVALWTLLTIPLVLIPELNHLYGSRPRWVVLFGTGCGFAAALWRVLRHPPRENAGVLWDRMLWVGLVAYTAVFVVLTFIRVDRMATIPSDTAWMEQALWNTLRGRFMFTTIHGGQNMLTAHNSPLMLANLPFYALFPHPLTILVVQAAFISVAGYGVYLIACQYVPKPLALLAAFAMLLTPCMTVGHYAWNDTLYGIGLLSLGYYCYVRGWLPACLVWLSLGLAAKEDLVLFVFAMAGLALLQRRRARWALSLACLASLWCVLTVMLLDERKTAHYSDWEKRVGVTSSAVDRESRIYLYQLLRPYGMGAALLAPEALLAVPHTALNLTVSYAALRAIEWRYSAVVQLALCIALLGAIGRVREKDHGQRYWSRYAGGAILLLFFGQLTYIPYWLRPSLFRITSVDQSTRRAAIVLIPPGAKVVASEAFVGYLAKRPSIRSIDDLSVEEALSSDYIIYSVAAVDGPGASRDARAIAGVLGLRRSGFELLFDSRGVRVWCKP